jgi:type II secretory pathway pseudopilin PulG
VTYSSSERRGGFVLLEAVVALAIIGLVAVALLSTTSAQLRTASKAGVLLTARSLAEDRIAAIRFLNHDDLADLPDSSRRWRTSTTCSARKSSSRGEANRFP